MKILIPMWLTCVCFPTGSRLPRFMPLPGGAPWLPCTLGDVLSVDEETGAEQINCLRHLALESHLEMFLKGKKRKQMKDVTFFQRKYTEKILWQENFEGKVFMEQHNFRDFKDLVQALRRLPVC